MSLSETNDAVFGPALTPNATYTKILAYRKAQGLPGPVDRWLIANIRSNRIGFLGDYLMLVDINGADCVECCIRSTCVKVSTLQLILYHEFTPLVRPDSTQSQQLWAAGCLDTLPDCNSTSSYQFEASGKHQSLCRPRVLYRLKHCSWCTTVDSVDSIYWAFPTASSHFRSALRTNGSMGSQQWSGAENLHFSCNTVLNMLCLLSQG